MNPIPRRVCAHCRAKKLKCDGALPSCSRCVRGHITADCVYEASSSKLKPVPALQKGNACLPCRRKKKRCDALQPFCTTCKIGGQEARCEYEGGHSYTRTLLARNYELETRLAQYEPDHDPETTSPSACSSSGTSDSSVSTGAMELASPVTSTDVVLKAAGVVVSQPLNGSIVLGSPRPPPHARRWSFTMPNLPNLAFSSIPQPMTRPSFALPPFDKLCTYFLTHRHQFGLTLPSVKLRAIARGDLSGTVIHPALVYVGALLGCLFWQEHYGHYDLATEETLLTSSQQAVGDVLRTMDAARNDVALVQIVCVFAVHYFFRHGGDSGRVWLQQAAEVVKTHTLPALRGTTVAPDGVATRRTPEELGSEAEERIAAIAQVALLERCGNIILHVPPLLDETFDELFLSMKTEDFWRTTRSTNLAILRVQSVIYLQQIRAFGDQWTTRQDEDTIDNAMRTRYWDLMREVTHIAATLSMCVQQGTFGTELSTVMAAKGGLIVALAAKMVLHRLLLFHTESRKLGIEAVRQIVALTDALEDENFICLDTIVACCWSLSADLLIHERKLALDTPAHGLVQLADILPLLESIGRAFSKFEMTLPYITPARKLCARPDPELERASLFSVSDEESTEPGEDILAP